MCAIKETCIKNKYIYFMIFLYLLDIYIIKNFGLIVPNI